MPFTQQEIQSIAKKAAQTPEGLEFLKYLATDKANIDINELKVIGQEYRNQKKLYDTAKQYGVDELPKRGIVRSFLDNTKAGIDLAEAAAYSLFDKDKMSLDDNANWAERGVKRNIEEAAKVLPSQEEVLAPEGSFTKEFPSAVKSLPQSLAVGIPGMVVGKGVQTAVSAIPGVGVPVGYAAGIAADAGVTAKLTYKPAKQQFKRLVRDEIKSKFNITQEQWDAVQDEIESKAFRFGKEEATGEMFSNAAEYALFMLPIPGGKTIAKLIGNKAARKILSKAGKLAGQVTGTTLAELGGETWTEKGQQDVLAETPYTEHLVPKEYTQATTAGKYAQSAKKVAPSTIIASTMQAGILGGASRLLKQLPVEVKNMSDEDLTKKIFRLQEIKERKGEKFPKFQAVALKYYADELNRRSQPNVQEQPVQTQSNAPENIQKDVTKQAPLTEEPEQAIKKTAVQLRQEANQKEINRTYGLERLGLAKTTHTSPVELRLRGNFAQRAGDLMDKVYSENTPENIPEELTSENIRAIEDVVFTEWQKKAENRSYSDVQLGRYYKELEDRAFAEFEKKARLGVKPDLGLLPFEEEAIGARGEIEKLTSEADSFIEKFISNQPSRQAPTRTIEKEVVPSGEKAETENQIETETQEGLLTPTKPSIDEQASAEAATEQIIEKAGTNQPETDNKTDLAEFGRIPSTKIQPVTPQDTSSGIYPPIEKSTPRTKEVDSETPASLTKATGKKAKSFTSDNKEIESEYSIYEANDLIASHDTDFKENKNYPQEIQPRDRDRKAMKLQVEGMANAINPELLGESATVTTGAPIVGKDAVVESGNGRTIALQKAYQNGKGEAYRQWLINNAEKFGLDKAKIEGMKNPVLARTRETDVNREDFVKKANQSDVARMSPTEQARTDADMLTNSDISLFAPSEEGDITASTNRTFIQRFTQKIGANEATGYTTESGGYTKQLIDRIRAAIFFKAYKNDSLLEMMAEDTDPKIKNILNALTVAAPEFVKARSVMTNLGNIDIVPSINAAALVISKTRNENIPVSEYLKQIGLFEQIPEDVKEIALFIDSNKRSGKKLGEYFKAIGSILREYLIDMDNAALPGFTKDKIDANVLIERAAKKLEDKYADRQQGLFEGQGKTQTKDSSGRSEESGREVSKRAETGAETGKISEAESGYQLKEPSQIPIPKFGEPEQLEIDFKPPKSIAVPKAIPPAQRTRMVTTGNIAAAGNVINSAADAASLLSHIRKSAQEVAYTVAVDKDGVVLEIHKYSKGTSGGSLINPVEIAGRVLNIKEAGKVYFVHNHPTGATEESAEDRMASSNLSQILALKDILLESLILGGTSYKKFDADEVHSGFFLPKKIRPQIKTQTLPVKERFLQKTKKYESLSSLSNSAEAKKYIQENYGGKSGILFLNTKNKPIDFIEYPKGEPTKTATAAIVKKAEETNTNAIIINSNETVENTPRQDFIKSLAIGLSGSIRLLDVISNGESWGDHGILERLLGNKNTFLDAHTALQKLNVSEPLFKLSDGWYSQMGNFLSDKLPNSAHSEQMSALIDSWALFKKGVSKTFSKPDITLVQKAMPYADVKQNNDGTINVSFKDGNGFTIDYIGKQEDGSVILETRYGNFYKPEAKKVAGAYLHSNKIILLSETSGKPVFDHEFVHFLERSGYLSKQDMAALAVELRRKNMPVSVEGRADLISDLLAKRDSIKAIPLKRAIQKVKDLVDMIRNLLGSRTALGVARDIESGKIIKGMETDNIKGLSTPAASYPMVQEGTKENKKLVDYMLKGDKIDNEKLFRQTALKMPSNDPKDLYKGIRWVQTMFDLARNYPELKKLLDVQTQRVARSHSLTSADKETTVPYYSLNKKSRANVNEAILKGDEYGETYTDTQLKDEFGLNDAEINGYKSIRKVLDDKFDDFIKSMLSNAVSGDVQITSTMIKIIKTAQDQEHLAEQMEKQGLTPTEIKRISWMWQWVKTHKGYLPHKWESEWLVKIETPTGEEWLLPVPTVKGRIGITRGMRLNAAKIQALSVVRDQFKWSNNEILAMFKKGKIEVVRSRKLDVSLFEGARMDVINSIVSDARDRMFEEYTKHLGPEEIRQMDKIKDVLQRYTEELYLAKGWGRHLMGRRGVKGYRTDVENIVAEYLQGANNFIVKGEAAKDFAKAMQHISPTKTPVMWNHAKEYISDMLGSSSEATAFKKVVGTFFLAGDLSAAALNMTQNWTHAVGMLREIEPPDKTIAEKDLAKGMKDALGEWASSVKNKRLMFISANEYITEKEVAYVKKAFNEGNLDPVFMGETTGFHENRIWMDGLNSFHSGLFKAFSGAEGLNRTSTFLAAFRRAKRAGYKSEDAYDKAIYIINSSHFVFGKGNRPLIIRKTGALGNIAFTFMTYPIGNLVFLKHRAENLLEAVHSGDRAAIKRNMKVVGSHLGYLFALGGVAGWPFMPQLAQLASKIFADDEDWEVLLRKYAPGTIGRLAARGIPAEYLGNDLSERIESTGAFTGLPVGLKIIEMGKKRGEKAWKFYQQDRLLDATFILMPDMFRSPYQAIKGIQEGGEREGVPPIKYTAMEAMVRGHGFTPSREAAVYKVGEVTRRKRERRQNKIAGLAEKYIIAKSRQDAEELEAIREEVRNYNEKQTGILGVKISMKDVKKSAKTREKSRGKGYLEKAPEYMGQYQNKISGIMGMKGE